MVICKICKMTVPLDNSVNSVRSTKLARGIVIDTKIVMAVPIQPPWPFFQKWSTRCGRLILPDALHAPENDHFSWWLSYNRSEKPILMEIGTTMIFVRMTVSHGSSNHRENSYGA